MAACTKADETCVNCLEAATHSFSHSLCVIFKGGKVISDGSFQYSFLMFQAWGHIVDIKLAFWKNTYSFCTFNLRDEWLLQSSWWSKQFCGSHWKWLLGWRQGWGVTKRHWGNGEKRKAGKRNDLFKELRLNCPCHGWPDPLSHESRLIYWAPSEDQTLCSAWNWARSNSSSCFIFFQ